MVVNVLNKCHHRTFKTHVEICDHYFKKQVGFFQIILNFENVFIHRKQASLCVPAEHTV